MTKDLWLPREYEIEEGIRIGSLLHYGTGWHIYGLEHGGKVLVALPGLTQKWIEAGYVEKDMLGCISFGSSSYIFLVTQEEYALSPLHSCSPSNKVDAIAFSLSLKESRKVSSLDSFHDAIYVEQYSMLLPTWSSDELVDDRVVLGSWITGGVQISAESFHRLHKLSGRLSPKELGEVVKAAGFTVPADAGMLTRRKGDHQQDSESKVNLKKSTRQIEEEKSQPETDKHFSLPGRPNLEAFFNEHVIDIIFNAERYQALGIEFPSAIILHGPPGCGKTYAVEQLVDFIGWPSFSIDSSSIGSPYIHETGKKISEIFDQAMDAAPSIVVIDEMESFLSDRQSGGSSSLHHVEEVAEFLRRIPEAINNRVLIIAMTNLIDMIDPAILRRGRFDHILEVGMPSREEVSSLIASLLEKVPVSENLQLDFIINALSGKPLSDSAFVIREAARLAAKTGKSQVDQASLDSALKSLPDDNNDQGKRIGFVWDS